MWKKAEEHAEKKLDGKASIRNLWTPKHRTRRKSEREGEEDKAKKISPNNAHVYYSSRKNEKRKTIANTGKFSH